MIVMIAGPGPTPSYPQGASGLPVAQKSEKKEFRLSLHYNFQERRYQPPVEIDLAKVRTDLPPRFGSAEQVLIAQIAAMKRLDAKAYLRTWDAKSREMLLARDPSLGEDHGRWESQWPQLFRRGDTLTLDRWLLTSPFVIVTYQLPKMRETAVGFKLSGEGWKATLELQDDPVFKHFADKKTEFETTIR